MLKNNKITRFVTSLFADKNLTKKAYLNALATALDYGVRLLVGFIIQPIMILGLGNYFYGLWQVLTRFVGYISPASGRPTYALKFMLANQQASTDYDLKRAFVGSSFLVWLIFLPVVTVLGGVLVWLVPSWLDIPITYIWYVRITILLLVANVSMESLAALPQSALQGQNLGYKRMGLSVLLVMFGGLLTWSALELEMGIRGVAGAALITTILNGLFYVFIIKRYAPWFGVARPESGLLKRFVGMSGWFLAWNLVMNLLNASDVVVLGLFSSVESVTPYTVTKYVPETLISFIAVIIFGIAPGLGGIIGSKDFKRAAELRNELLSITWLFSTVFGITILLWNKAFVNLWVDEKQFAGVFPLLFIVLAIIQFVLIRVDVNMMDLSLRLAPKVILGSISAVVSIGAASVLVSVFELGIIGVSAGLIFGRSILTFGYPIVVGRQFNIPFSSQLKGAVRPVLVTAIFFSISMWISKLTSGGPFFSPDSWILLVLDTGFTALLTLFFVYFVGLTSSQRKKIWNRVKMILLPAN